jgi:hypothetical protein
MSATLGTIGVPVWSELGQHTYEIEVEVLARHGALVAHETINDLPGVVVTHEATGCRLCRLRDLRSAEALMAKLQQFPWNDLALKPERLPRSNKAALVSRPKWMEAAKAICQEHQRRERAN